MAFPGALIGGISRGVRAPHRVGVGTVDPSGKTIPRRAARALGVTLTEHATILARAKAALAKIEAGMA